MQRRGTAQNAVSSAEGLHPLFGKVHKGPDSRRKGGGRSGEKSRDRLKLIIITGQSFF